MITLSNTLSFLRAPLAFLFLQESASLRILAIVLAMITDSIDGYLARRSQSSSRFGAILDPTMDKFFVYFALSVLFLEGRVNLPQTLALLSRDFSLCLYGAVMLITRRWKTIQLQAIRWGKVTTAFQFLVLIAIVGGISFPWPIYALFVIMGYFAFIELYKRPLRDTGLSL
jgi:CDP-diacylglycerol---glycerol-3-phosphate 3-phosphatidyltransferase